MVCSSFLNNQQIRVRNPAFAGFFSSSETVAQCGQSGWLSELVQKDNLMKESIEDLTDFLGFAA